MDALDKIGEAMMLPMVWHQKTPKGLLRLIAFPAMMALQLCFIFIFVLPLTVAGIVKICYEDTE